MAKLSQNNRQKLSVLNKGVMAVAGASILGMVVYFTVFMNTADVSKSNAGVMSKNMMLGFDNDNGDVISSFTFDDGDPGKAKIGPDAFKIGKGAIICDGGMGNTKGLCIGAGESDVRLEIPASKEFNTDGLDINLDYRNTDDNGSFYSRGSYFNFGIKKGQLVIAYSVTRENGKTEDVTELTRYQIPRDDEFRNYRFVYSPTTGRGEILVNGVSVWSHTGESDKPLYWKGKDNIIIGEGLKGDKSKTAFIDNFTIKATQHANTLPIKLLAFQAEAKEEGYVMISWYTAKEMDVDSFIVERSMDAINFSEIGRVKAAGNSDNLLAYALVDKNPPANQVAYYRLLPSNKPLKSVTVPLIGFKYRKDHIENTYFNDQTKSQPNTTSGQK